MEIILASLASSALSWFTNMGSVGFLKQHKCWQGPPAKARPLLKFRQTPAYTTLPLPKPCNRLNISLRAACSPAQRVCAE